MAKIFDRVTDLIGGTPLVAFDRIAQAHGAKARILAKLECMNPAGSAKDRAALSMIEDAERSGKLKPGATIIEPTSGNTGIGLASVAAPRGYHVILVMPETMSLERRRLIAAYGAEIVLTPGKLGMQGAVDKANELNREIPGSIIAGQFVNPANPAAHYKSTGPEIWRDTDGMQGAVDKANELNREIPGSIIAGQFVNPANPAAHYKSTGPEIWRDTDGNVDVFVAGIGTGGTITGVGRYLKEQNPGVQVVAVEPADSPLLSTGKAGPHGVAVEPADSPLLSTGKAGPHGIQGIGANFVPEALDRTVYDQVKTVQTADANAIAREIARTEGILVGISSGAAVSAALELAKQPEFEGKTIVVMLPDTGERYLSTGIFDD